MESLISGVEMVVDWIFLFCAHHVDTSLGVLYCDAANIEKIQPFVDDVAQNHRKTDGTIST